MKFLLNSIFFRMANFLAAKCNFIIFYSLQFDFRPKRFNANALIYYVEPVLKSLDSEKFGCYIFINLRKAFCKVNRYILLDSTTTAHHDLLHLCLNLLFLACFKCFFQILNQFLMGCLKDLY